MKLKLYSLPSVNPADGNTSNTLMKRGVTEIVK